MPQIGGNPGSGRNQMLRRWPFRAMLMARPRETREHVTSGYLCHYNSARQGPGRKRGPILCPFLGVAQNQLRKLESTNATYMKQPKHFPWYLQS